MIDRLRRPLGLVCVAVLLPTGAAAADWTPFGVGAGAVCADGSEAHLFERIADPEKVVLYLEGGGACWSESTCAFEGPDRSYNPTSDVTAGSLGERGGLFDFSNPQNPLADHSFVYVPYCTGDFHLGSTTRAYGDDLIIEHRGAATADIALDHLVTQFPEASEIVVTGVSAGSVPTPLYAAVLSDSFPEARIVTLGDGSGSYPDDPVLNAFMGTLWGVMDSVPDWPETTGLSVRDWSVPGLYVHGGNHAPDTTFARFDFAFDEAQVFYGEVVGVAAQDLVTLMDLNEAEIEAQGITLASYTAPGSEHTLLWRDLVYELEVEGVRLIDWISELVSGRTPADVHCLDCR